MSESIRREIGNLYKELRIASGMTQLDWARKLEISQSALSKLENGKLEPSLSAFCIGYQQAHTLPLQVFRDRFNALLWNFRGDA
jgi:DNA-binding XRE family transcriptional regulator